MKNDFYKLRTINFSGKKDNLGLCVIRLVGVHDIVNDKLRQSYFYDNILV